MKALLIIVGISISSCSTTPPITALPLPPEIPLESRITEAEIECVSDPTYAKIVLLDKRRETLRAIIESTHTQ